MKKNFTIILILMLFIFLLIAFFTERTDLMILEGVSLIMGYDYLLSIDNEKKEIEKVENTTVTEKLYHLGLDETNPLWNITKDALEHKPELTYLFDLKTCDYEALNKAYETKERWFDDYIITKMIKTEDNMLKVTFTKRENMKKMVDVIAKDGSFESTYTIDKE